VVELVGLVCLNDSSNDNNNKNKENKNLEQQFTNCTNNYMKCSVQEARSVIHLTFKLVFTFSWTAYMQH